MKDNRIGIGILFLLLQLCLIIYARFVPERFFCWAPYDEQTTYKISVDLDDRQLSTGEIIDRYRYGAQGLEPRTIHNVFSMIEQYEKTYGADDNAKVMVRYSTNGKPEREWHFAR